MWLYKDERQGTAYKPDIRKYTWEEPVIMRHEEEKERVYVHAHVHTPDTMEKKTREFKCLIFVQVLLYCTS